MSDSEDSNGGPLSAIRRKKRRAISACDECHRRKVKCDGDQMLNNICSGCISLGIECTHLVQKKKRGPKNKTTTPTSKTEQPPDVKTLITTILAAPKTVVIPKDESVIRSMLVDLAQYSRSLENQLQENARSSSSPPTSKSSPFSVQNDDTDDEEQESLTLRVQNLSLDNALYKKHVGKSSHFMLLQTALDIRDEIGGGTISIGTRRPEFWNIAPFHRFCPPPEEPPYEFPEDDLLRKLVDVYFSSFHPVYPLLHRPSFERQVYVERLHLSNQRFGAVLLAVCAVASRFTEDPRVLSEGTQEPRSAGWKYISQIRLFKTSNTDVSTLFDIQVYSLAVTFLFPTPLGDIGWLLSSFGIRCAQEYGAHRKGKAIKPGLSRMEEQLWKRAFWNLMTTDMYASIATGRPRALREDDFDTELPPECDDEYWEIPSNPELEFIQPVGKISHMSYWHHFQKLLRVAGLIKDHLFTTRKATPWLDNSPDLNEKLVMELDSALNSWRDQLPEHLKWDPHRTDDILFSQTVMMHSNFYWVQIQLHKMFVRPGARSSFPSLAICANAARSYVHMLQVYLVRPGMPNVPSYIAPTFVAGLMLLINIWTSIRDKASYDPRKDMKDVYNCLDHLSIYEQKYENAGRLRDILDAVISFSQMPPPPPQKESLKRSRDPQAVQPDPMQTDTTRQFAGSRRVSNSLNPTFFSGGSSTATGVSGGSTFHQQSAPGVFSATNAPASVFDTFYGVNMGGQDQLHSLDTPPQSILHSEPSTFGFGSFSGGGADVSSFGSLGMEDPRVTASAWNNPNHEDWTSFMSKVDDLLNFVNTDGF